MRLFRNGLIAALATLGACAATPDPVYYLLPTPEIAASAPYSGGTVAVRELALPLYARAQQVASLAEDGSVALSDDHRWADEPARASTRAFVAALKQLTGAPIVAEPWPANVTPAIRIDIAVDRFIGDIRGGDVEFSGQYRIVRTGGGDGDQDTFTYRIPIDGAGYKPLAAAHSAAISRLAQDIAARMTSGV
jgi:uncharacterized lipoprotein YmbA